MKINYIIYFWVANHHQSLQDVNGGKTVAMNHTTKQCRCLEGDDRLRYPNDFIKVYLCEI
jgi:hypothetical protein